MALISNLKFMRRHESRHQRNQVDEHYGLLLYSNFLSIPLSISLQRTASFQLKMKDTKLHNATASKQNSNPPHCPNLAHTPPT
jgi:hypothetical protein